MNPPTMAPVGERAGAPIDPRFQARRRQVAQARHRRRRRWWLVVLAAAVLVVVGWSVTRSPLLDVDEVVIEGTGRTSVDDVRAVAEVSAGDQLLEVDAGAVRARVLALPWVADVAVDVDWGGTVRLRVAERAPVATVVGADGQPVLVDGTGRALGPVTAADAGLVSVEGLAAAPAPGSSLDAVAGDALAVAAALQPGVRTRVAAVVRGEGGEVTLRLQPSGEAWLGPATQVDAKVRALQALFSQAVDWCVTSVDLRVPDQVAVTRDQACLAALVPSAGSTGSGSGAGSAGSTSSTRSGTGSQGAGSSGTGGGTGGR